LFRLDPILRWGPRLSQELLQWDFLLLPRTQFPRGIWAGKLKQPYQNFKNPFWIHLFNLIITNCLFKTENLISFSQIYITHHIHLIIQIRLFINVFQSNWKRLNKICLFNWWISLLHVSDFKTILFHFVV
jgi:hypothetical protein